MKFTKLLIALSLLIYTTICQAQNFKDGIYIDGNIGFRKTTKDLNIIPSPFTSFTNDAGTEINNSLDFGSSVNYFVNKNLSIGLVMGLQSSRTEQNRKSNTRVPDPNIGFSTSTNTFNETLSETKIYSLGLRSSYFVNITDKLNFTPIFSIIIFNGVQTFEQEFESLNIISGSIASSVFKTETDVSGFSAHIVPALTYMLSEKIALSLSFGEIGYLSEKSENITESHSDEFKFDLDLSSLKLGFQYYFIKGNQKNSTNN